jgi:hypothetical protein
MAAPERFGVVPHAVFLQNACPAAHCAPRNAYTRLFHRHTLVMTQNRSVAFFDAQFEKEISAGDYALNRFEQSALMFFPQKQAMALLDRLQRAVKPGGVAIVNVLIDGTTHMGMFEPRRYCLFGRDELLEKFVGWHVLRSTHEGFDAPGGTRKEFSTVIARRQ